MSSEVERQFVEGAARVAYVMAWAEREENPPDNLRTIHWHDRTAVPGDGGGKVRGVWGERLPSGSREFKLLGGGSLYLFDDEVDSDTKSGGRPFAGQRIDLLAPPTPNYAREWAWKLLGALEEINPQWGRNLPSICVAASRADHHLMTDNDVRVFGSDIAMTALGTGVSWFDSHATFELHIPDREFIYDDDES